MSGNPYQSPLGGPMGGEKSGNRAHLRNIAKYQKGILTCILIYLISVIANFAVPAELRIFMILGGAAVSIASAVFVFLLAVALYGTALGIVLGILTLIPCIGLIVLLIVNGKATAQLKENGYRVGLMGADMSQF